MQLTTAQLQVLKTDIESDPVFDNEPQTSDGDFAIADAYSLQASPDFTVWRTNITLSEIKGQIDWTEFDNLSASRKDTFFFMSGAIGSDGGVSLDASDVNIQQGIQDIFQGGQQATTRNALVALGKRLATRIEKLFAVGAGTIPNPSTMVIEGRIGYREIGLARRLP